MEQFGFSHFIASLDVLGMGVLMALFMLSVASWYIIMTKGVALYGLNRQTDRFMDHFVDADTMEKMVELSNDSLYPCDLSRVLKKVTNLSMEYKIETLDTMSTRILHHSIDKATEETEKGMILLASAGSVAPFIGLFGTVWGIYHALLTIGMMTQGSLDKVAGPVGEALIMTALGLGVAIPAVLAYNAFTRVNRLYLAKLDGFAHDVHLMIMNHALGQNPKES